MTRATPRIIIENNRMFEKKRWSIRSLKFSPLFSSRTAKSTISFVFCARIIQTRMINLVYIYLYLSVLLLHIICPFYILCNIYYMYKHIDLLSHSDQTTLTKCSDIFFPSFKMSSLSLSCPFCTNKTIIIFGMFKESTPNEEYMVQWHTQKNPYKLNLRDIFTIFYLMDTNNSI